MVNRDASGSLRARRFAANQTVFRRANERLDRERRRSRTGSVRYICECGDDACTEPVPLLPSEYEHVRSRATWFLIAPGHEILADAAERVVENHERYQVVEKHGAAGRVAEATTTRH